MRSQVLGGALAAGLLLSGCTGGSDDPAPADPSPGTSVSGSGPAPAWSSPLAEQAFRATPPDEAANPVVVGDHLVVLGATRVTAYDAASGETAWETPLPGEVCGGSRPAVDPADASVVAVLLGTFDGCTDVAAVDAGDGRLLWTAPIPRASQAFGHEAAVGGGVVTVSGECAGFSRLRLTDGSVASTVTGRTVDGRCPSAAGDGASVVLASAGRLSVYDAATGARRSTLPPPAGATLGRVGDVVTQDPLVVTARFADGGFLVDLSGSDPVPFGRDGGWFGGEVASSARLGSTLWVEYDDEDGLFGYDLLTHEPAGTVELAGDADLAGVHGDRLVVTVRSPDARELVLVDPAAPDRPEELGTFPLPEDDDGTLRQELVVGDRLVRLWDGLVEAYPLPPQS